MTATAVAGDRGADPALCSTRNSSTRPRRASPSPTRGNGRLGPAFALRLRRARQPALPAVPETPDSRCPSPESRCATPDSRLPSPDSRLPTPEYDPPVSKPVLAVGLLAAMASAWYWALLPAVHPPTPGSGRRAPTVPAAVEVPDVRLRDLAAHGASMPLPGGARNPFQDAHPPTPATVASTAGPAEHVPAAGGASVGAPASSWPRLELIGLAEARQGGGVVRTAIVAGPRGVMHARPGDVLERVYRLERIGTDGVDVRLVPEDRVIRLALPP